jgi:hypothetical protein
VLKFDNIQIPEFSLLCNEPGSTSSRPSYVKYWPLPLHRNVLLLSMMQTGCRTLQGFPELRRLRTVICGG